MKRAAGPASVLVGILIGVGLFWYAFRDIRLSEVLRMLSELKAGWLPLLVLLPVLDLWFRAVRWRILLKPIVRSDVGILLQLEAVGLAVNNLLFLRLGELARGIVASRELGVHMLSILASIIVERLCDTAALLTLFVLCSARMPGVLDPRVPLTAAAVVFGIVGVLALITLTGTHLHRWFPRLSEHPRLDRAVRDITLGTRSLRSWRAACWVAVLSLGLWFCDAAVFWVGARGVGFDPPLSWSQSLVVLSSAAVGTALPAVPGAFGNFEGTVKFILVRFGYEARLAVPYATFLHVISYAVVTSLGILFLYRLGHTFSGIRSALTKERAR